MYRMASILFNREVSIPIQASGGVSDKGLLADLLSIQQTVDDGFAMNAEQIQKTSDDQWTEIVLSAFGEVRRMQVLAFLMHHNSYHAGQIA